MPTPRALDLDLDAASRQSIGTAYGRPRNLDGRVELLRSGVLRIYPHGDWRGDYTDWDADPFRDRNWQFQFHSLRWTSPLRWAALDGDLAARREWLRIIRSWFETNVPFRPGLASFAWKDMTDGNRAIHLSLGAALVEQEDDWFVDLLRYHRDWLLDPSHIKKKNHGLHQHNGLLVVAAVLGDRNAMDTAVRRMEAQFFTAFDVQGCNDEGSVGYQQHNLKWWKAAWQRAGLEGYEVQGVPERLEAAAHALAHMSMPNGQVPQIGDTARGSIARGVHPFADFAATRGAMGRKPEGAALVLDGGYVLSRSGWGEQRPIEQESHMVMRHGEHVRSHSHQDRGSIHIYASGRRWLTDSGFHSYQPGDPTRVHLASRAAHNVAFIPGLEHDVLAPVELVSQSISDSVHDFTVVDRGYRNEEVSRRVVYLSAPDCWLVIDAATGPGPVTLAQQWHLEPGTQSRFRDRGFALTQDGQELHMTWLGKQPDLGRKHAETGSFTAWIGTQWKTLTPGTLLTAKVRGTAMSPLVTLISPSSPQPLGIVDTLVQRNGSVRGKVTRGERVWNFNVGGAGAVVTEI